MSQPAYKLRFPVDLPTFVGSAPRPAVEPEEHAPEIDDAETDPYYYGWRERWEKTTDGGEKLRWIPLTYQDLLDPQEGDVVAEDTIHREVTELVASILRCRYDRHPTVAVWRNLKIAFEIPGLTSGPGPDVCVVVGVHDRDRRRERFRYGEEAGKIRLVVEVVSENSLKKDYQDLLKIYGPLGVEDYVTIRPIGLYPEGPFELRGWRRDPQTEQLVPIAPDQQGRIQSQTMGLLFGTGAGGLGLAIWDAATEERLRTWEEEAWLAERAERAKKRIKQATTVRRAAEKCAEQEAPARRVAEEEIREMRAEIERLRAELQKREAGDTR